MLLFQMARYTATDIGYFPECPFLGSYTYIPFLVRGRFLDSHNQSVNFSRREIRTASSLRKESPLETVIV